MRNKAIRNSILIILLFLLASCSPEFKNHYLSSEMVGNLKWNNQPMENVLLIRSSKSSRYDENPVVDSVITDNNGNFKFKKRTKFSFITLLHQPVINHNIKVVINDTTLKTIYFTKMNYDKNGELVRHVNYKDKGYSLHLDNGKLQLLLDL